MDTLVVKVFAIVAGMLGVTAIAAQRNKAFETRLEFWGLLIGGLVLLFVIPALSFPLNLGLTMVFAFIMGSLIGPGIKSIMMNFVVRQQLKSQGYTKDQLKALDSEEVKRLTAELQTAIESGNDHPFVNEWNKVFSLAIYSTAAITIIAGAVVSGFDFDFSFLGNILFIALIGLIVVSLINAVFVHSPLMRLINAYVGAVIFSAYLLYDFDRLEKAAGVDSSWETAINIAISIYLDVINLFLDLLEILSSD